LTKSFQPEVGVLDIVLPVSTGTLLDLIDGAER
jgi:hypothetical protein